MSIVDQIVERSIRDISQKGKWLFNAEYRDLKLEVKLGYGAFQDNLMSQQFSDDIIQASLEKIVQAYQKEAEIRLAIKQLKSK